MPKPTDAIRFPPEQRLLAENPLLESYAPEPQALPMAKGTPHWPAGNCFRGRWAGHSVHHPKRNVLRSAKGFDSEREQQQRTESRAQFARLKGQYKTAYR